MASDLRDGIVRSTHFAAALREVGVLLVIFGPFSVTEIFHVVTIPVALAIWTASVVLLVLGVDWDVRIERRKRRLSARGLL